MDKRNIITVVAFLLPVVVVAGLVSSSPKEKKSSVGTVVSELANLEAKRDKTQARLVELQKMTQADWDKEGNENPNRRRAPSLADALVNNSRKLDELNGKIKEINARNAVDPYAATPAKN